LPKSNKKRYVPPLFPGIQQQNHHAATRYPGPPHSLVVQDVRVRDQQFVPYPSYEIPSYSYPQQPYYPPTIHSGGPIRNDMRALTRPRDAPYLLPDERNRSRTSIREKTQMHEIKNTNSNFLISVSNDVSNTNQRNATLVQKDENSQKLDKLLQEIIEIRKMLKQRDDEVEKQKKTIIELEKIVEKQNKLLDELDTNDREEMTRIQPGNIYIRTNNDLKNDAIPNRRDNEDFIGPFGGTINTMFSRARK